MQLRMVAAKLRLHRIIFSQQNNHEKFCNANKQRKQKNKKKKPKVQRTKAKTI